MSTRAQYPIQFDKHIEDFEIGEGELPSSWEWVRLGDLVDNPKQDLVDGPFGSNLKANEYIESGIPVFKIQNIKANRFVNKRLSYISKEKAESLHRHSFQAGDLIITKLGEPLGLCCQVPKEFLYGIIVADLMRLRPSTTRVDINYLTFAINSKVVQNQFKAITKGTTRARVNLTIVRDIKIPLPSLSEQQEIVAKIEELLSELDKGKEQLETALKQLKAYRRAVLKWAFEGRFTNSDVKDGELPEGWKWVKIGEVAESLDNRRKPVNKEERLRRRGDIPYYGANGRTGWINDYLFDEPLILVVEDETFVGRELPFSYKITGKSWVNNHAHILKPKEKLNIDFLNYQLTYYPFLPLTTGTTGRKKLTKNALMNAPFKICSIEEQSKIVEEAESRLSVCDKVEETISQSLQQAETLRQSILKRAFEGKLIETSNCN